MLGSLRERTVLQEIAAAASTPYADSCRADKPILWLHLDDATGSPFAADSSSSNLPGTYKGTPTLGATGLIESEPGYAVTLGEGDFIEIAHNTLLNHGDVFTYEAVIELSSVGGGENCICFKQGTGGTTAKFVVNTEGKLLLRVPGFANLAIGKTVLEKNVRYHVAATKTGATNKVYVNGVDDTASTEAREVTNNSGALRIGSEAGEATENFNGTVDELKWYGTALSAARILAHYEAALAEEAEEYEGKAEDTAKLADAVLRVVTGSRGDTTTLADAAAMSAALARGDTTTLADGVVRVASVVLGDTAAAADALAKSFLAAIDDGPVPLADAAARAVALDLADSAAAEDALARSHITVLADAAAIADAAAKVFAMPAEAVTAPLSDALARLGVLALADAAEAADAASRGLSLGLGDAVAAEDARARAWDAIRSLEDAVGLSDEATPTLIEPTPEEYELLIEDSLALADALTRNVGLRLGDTPPVVDALARTVAVTVASGLALGDGVQRAWEALRAVEDAAGTADGVTRAAALAFAQDPLALADALIRAQQMQIAGDGIAAGDALARAVALMLADEVALAEKLILPGTPVGIGGRRMERVAAARLGRVIAARQGREGRGDITPARTGAAREGREGRGYDGTVKGNPEWD